MSRPPRSAYFATKRSHWNPGRTMAMELTEDELAAIESELNRMRQEHRDLDSAIDALERLGASDQLQVQRLKKRKLYLRDRISQLEDQITPDIIA